MHLGPSLQCAGPGHQRRGQQPAEPLPARSCRRARYSWQACRDVRLTCSSDIQGLWNSGDPAIAASSRRYAARAALSFPIRRDCSASWKAAAVPSGVPAKSLLVSFQQAQGLPAAGPVQPGTAPSGSSPAASRGCRAYRVAGPAAALDGGLVLFAALRRFSAARRPRPALRPRGTASVRAARRPRRPDRPRPVCDRESRNIRSTGPAGKESAAAARGLRSAQPRGDPPRRAVVRSPPGPFPALLRCTG